MNKPRLVLVSSSLAFAFVVGCGGASAPPADSPHVTDANLVIPVKQGQMKVLRLATGDGRIRLVIDRSGPKPKMRRDGEADVVELTMEEDRRSGELRGHALVDPSGRRRLYLYASGDYSIFEGRDELPLRADGQAEPLPAATVRGAPVYEKTPSENDAAVLTAIAVRTKMPSMKPEDASRIAKVEEAIKKADKSMFVRYVVYDAKDVWQARMEVTPSDFSGTAYGGVAHSSSAKWQPAKETGLRKFGGMVQGFTDYGQHGHMQVLKLDGYSDKLASGTPGLVWEVDGGTAVFVSLDGARFNVSLGQKAARIEPGAGNEAEWPAPLPNALLDITDLTALVKVGEVPKAVETELFAQDDEWFECTRKVWQSVERKIDSYKFTEADRKDTVKRAERECAAPVRKQEQTFLGVVEARAKARAALFETAKARVREVAKK